MSNKIILEVNEKNDKEIYPPFFPQHFFIKEQPRNNFNHQPKIKTNPNNFFNNRIKSNLPYNNNMFFMRKF